MHFPPFVPKQPLEDITVNDAELYPDPDSTNDVDFLNNKIPSQNLIEADNHQISHNQQDQEQQRTRIS